MIEKYEYDGETYRVVYKENEGLLSELNILDESYCVPHDAVYNAVLDIFLSTKDFSAMPNRVLYSWIKMMKPHCDFGSQSLKGYFACKTLCERLMENNDYGADAVRKVSSIYISCLRKISTPQKAIDFYEKARMICGNTLDNPFVLTSVAATYCDLKEYEKAHATANRAYAMQGGGTGYSNELALVYKRIKKESGVGTDFS